MAKLWAVYYFFIYTFGLNPLWSQRIIWYGALVVGVISLPVFLRYQIWRDVPREGVLLLLFNLWCMTGYFTANNPDAFNLYLRQIAELALIVIFVAVILRQSGEAKWFYLAFVAVSVFHLLTQQGAVNLERLQEHERFAYANTLGFNSFLGILGLLAIYKEFPGIGQRGLMAVSLALAMYGVVLSASRGALAATIVLVLLWIPFCLVGSARFKVVAFVGAALILYLGYGLFQFIIEQTYMGIRFMKAILLEDGSSTTRLELAKVGLRLFLRNPLVGSGVGQFMDASGRGLNAHSEFVEIAATTGLPGLLLYYSVFGVAWRRLSRSRMAPTSLPDQYQINMARVALITLLLSGAITRPNFLSQNTMFMLGVIVGMAHWAERKAQWILWQTGQAARDVYSSPKMFGPPASTNVPPGSTAPARPQGHWGSLIPKGHLHFPAWKR